MNLDIVCNQGDEFDVYVPNDPTSLIFFFKLFACILVSELLFGIIIIIIIILQVQNHTPPEILLTLTLVQYNISILWPIILWTLPMNNHVIDPSKFLIQVHKPKKKIPSFRSRDRLSESPASVFF